jgi:N-(5-amino-5-carboxypentanoyl)-L-cysteinyl-D-valine synthase
LVIIDDEEKRDPHKLPQFIKRHGITYLNGTASVLQEYDYSDCPSLSKLVLVGEDLTVTRYKALRRKFKHRIINKYGFTEPAFVTAMKDFAPDSERTDRYEMLSATFWTEI